MRRAVPAAVSAFAAMVLMSALPACGEKPAPTPDPTPTPAAQPAPAPAPPPAPAAEPAKTEPVTVPAATPAPKPKPAVAPKLAATPKPTATPTPTPTPTATPTASAPPSVPDNGHARVGPEKCKGCHRTQYDSWSASAHQQKGLDCEGCHGHGADYRASSVMKDAAAARAAGLVMPGLDLCRKCHGAKAEAAMLPKAHAHKAK